LDTNEQILGEFKNSKIVLRKIVAKNAGNILSQLLDKIMEKSMKP
jgi:hypothetical protein